MENACKMQRRSHLPNTSRVNEKIKEYYTKFGRDRELEKFMRLYSPAGSHNSHRSGSPICNTPTPTSVSSYCASDDATGSCGGAALRKLFRESAKEFVISASKSLPNMEVRENEVNVPIRLEGGSDEVIKRENSKTSEDIQTPDKPGRGSKLTQTPDSIAKSHKRLEWDSWGDVGYKKAISTSNISVLERTLLKEFFQESSTSTTSSNKATHTNVSEGDLKKLQREEKYNTPPLASSTFAEAKHSPKYTTQGTCTSLLKRFEKYAQTTLQRPKYACQEVQVNLSSNATSLIGNSTTPSSFEYYSSRSSRSNTTSNDGVSNNHKASGRRTEHAFTCGIPEMSRRKVLAEINSQDEENEAVQLQQWHSTLKQALTENKENSSSASMLRLPQVDLGIQLLCSLIDAKSLKNKQKKQLMRDIVKRISLMSSSSSEIASKNASTTNSIVSRRSSNIPSAHAFAVPTRRQENEKIFKSGPMESELEPKAIRKHEKRSRSGEVETLLSKNGFERLSEPETSAKALRQLASRNATKKDRENLNNSEAKSEYTGPEFDVIKVAPPNKERAEIYREMQIEMPHEQPLTSATTTQIATAQKPQTTKIASAQQPTTNSPTIANVSPISTSNTTTTSSSKEITTQKPAADLNNSNNTDAEQVTMREWLNPLTHSEIEYEDRKHQLARNAKRREKLLRETQQQKTKSEREVQLNWIETEIQRLESLRHLLLKKNNSMPTMTNRTGQSQEMNKIYDTVCSSTSSVLSASAERMVQEIEVIIEESQEDVVNLEDNYKCTKERKRQTQIYYDKPCEENLYGQSAPQGKARFRTVKETITTNEEQLLHSGSGKEQNVTQRSKMETPTMGSTDSESVRSFVQQRKREFMAHYNNKRKNHHDALQQQQRQHLESRPPTNSIVTRAAEEMEETSGHYSEAHTMPRHRVRDEYTQLTMPPAPPPPPSHFAARARMSNIASGDLASQFHSKEKQTQLPSSSSSMFGVSSEISIPMGSNDSSSTPTTTHQYDDVAAAAGLGIGVGVQTSESMLCTHPILRKTCPACHHVMYSSSTIALPCACVQIKSKGIAYVIQFDKNSNSTSTFSGAPTSGTTTGIIATSDGETAEQTPVLTLQEHLERARPEFLTHSKERKAILNKIQALRQEREREMREIIDNVSISSLDNHLNGLPPPPTKQIRVFGTKKMKALTSKHFAQLPEVRERQQREREERQRRSNRVLRDVFNQRLQRRVRSGKLSLNHSSTVI